MFLPFATATLITFILAWLICEHKISIIGKRILRLFLYYVPVIILAIVFSCVVPNSVDKIVLPAKIVSYFIPLVWFVLLVVFLSIVTNKKDNKEETVSKE
jgi:hypothetical protein